MTIRFVDESGLGTYHCERATYYLQKDACNFHVDTIVSLCPPLFNYVLSYEDDNLIKLTELAEVDGPMPHPSRLALLGEAPFCFSCLRNKTDQALPNGLLGENYSPLSMNCRTMSLVLLACCGFSEEQIEHAYSRLNLPANTFLCWGDAPRIACRFGEKCKSAF